MGIMHYFRASDGSDEAIHYSYTQDRALQRQYYMMRDGGDAAANHAEGEDIYDKIGDILIAQHNTLCLGGALLNIREPDEYWLLPTESEHFLLRPIFPELALHTVRHAEISRIMVIEDSTLAQEIFEGVCSALIARIKHEKVGVFFFEMPRQWLEVWQKLANEMAISYRIPAKNLQQPNARHYTSATHYFIICDMR